MSYDSASIAFAPYGDYWRQLRKICVLELLNARRVHSFRSIREEEAKKLTESIASSSGQPINLSEKIVRLTTGLTSRAAFGQNCKDQDEFVTVVKKSVKLAGGFDFPDLFPSLTFLHSISRAKSALERMHRKVDKIPEDIIDDHVVKWKSVTTSSHRSGEEDLVDVLLKLQDSSDLEIPITTNIIKADIFTAGSDTSSTTMEWAMSEMIRKPRVMEKAQAEVSGILKGKSSIEETDVLELTYLKLVIKETLRAKPALEEIHRKVDRILQEIIKDHTVNRKAMMTGSCRSGEKDLVDVLLKLQESVYLEVPVTTNNIKAVILNGKPRIMEKAQAEVSHILNWKRKIEERDIQELNYLKLVIKETLRLHPPNPLLLPREARERCEVNSYEVPKKTKVMINTWAIGRDPEYWTIAESFEPERFCESSVDFKGTNFEPFGAGRRIRPGMLFGITNIEIPLAQLLYHFNWKLVGGSKPEELNMIETLGASTRKKNVLHLIATPYIPLIHEIFAMDF
ncbi:hypothetical protein RJ639_009066 [Escallonia herrerae]|uniref:Cytochrome P450 n=1 Tax=Escallonia herrerae TaxID=1293975 RepID=A0AA88VSX6_9ASTE|nr:hypothetical protein RJ639_009066 [Escallonia herrerae]